MSNRPQFESFDEFWLYYLCEHRSPANRWLHFIGTSLALLLLVAASALGRWDVLLAVPVCGYAMAWTGHFFIERNRPASLKYPGWSLIGDLRMWALMLRGRLAGELERAAAKSEIGFTADAAAAE